MSAADDDGDEDSDAKDQDSETDDQDGDGPVRKKVKTLKNEKIVKPVTPVSQQSQRGWDTGEGEPGEERETEGGALTACGLTIFITRTTEPHSFLLDPMITLTGIRTHTLTMDHRHYATLVYPCRYR